MPPRRASRADLILVALTLATGALAAVMWHQGRASGLEAASFVTGAVCVWLTVRANVWNFPIGMINVATYSVVFFRARLYGDAALQVVYFALGAIGWAMWLRRSQDGGEPALHLARASRRELLLTTLFCAVATAGLWQVLHRTGSSASFLDALTTAISLGAQWLLNRKRLESWIGWILVDLIYVPLYLSKGLTLTAILYAVFLVMAVLGLREWRERLRAQAAAGAAP